MRWSVPIAEKRCRASGNPVDVHGSPQRLHNWMGEYLNKSSRVAREDFSCLSRVSELMDSGILESTAVCQTRFHEEAWQPMSLSAVQARVGAGSVSGSTPVRARTVSKTRGTYSRVSSGSFGAIASNEEPWARQSEPTLPCPAL